MGELFDQCKGGEGVAEAGICGGVGVGIVVAGSNRKFE